MSDFGIFVVGAFAFLLLSGGWIYTVREVQRLGAKADARRQSSSRSAPTSRVDRD